MPNVEFISQLHHMVVFAHTPSEKSLTDNSNHLQLRALPEREARGGDEGDARHRLHRHQQEDGGRVDGPPAGGEGQVGLMSYEIDN